MLIDTTRLAKKLEAKQIALLAMSDTMQYSRVHIPGARHLPYRLINQYSRQQLSLSIGSQNIARLMAQLSIKSDRYIVICHDSYGLNAFRLFWELERLGHAKISLLDADW